MLAMPELGEIFIIEEENPFFFVTLWLKIAIALKMPHSEYTILLPWSLLGASLLCTLVAAAFFMLRVWPVRKCHRRSADPLMPLEPREFEPCAVVVYSRDQAAQLEILLPEILGQDYPADFEVIVVNEGESPSVSDVVGMLQLRHPNLYLTSTPDGARNLSRKKLAITLGIKATRKPVVVLTTAGTEVHSTQWLRSMMQHFRAGDPTEVVLGYAYAPPYDDTAFGARARSFDSTVDAASWIGRAVAGRPWRGTEHNLAYRRDTFFANKGFSRRLNLRYGDDDIFVSEIATGKNTAIELSEESMVSLPGALSPRSFRDERLKRAFTRKFIPNRPRLTGMLGFGFYFVAPLLALGAAVVSWHDYVVVSISVVCLLLWFMAGMLWNMALSVLHSRRLALSTPLLAFSLPLRKISRSISTIFKHNKHYTWE